MGQTQLPDILREQELDFEKRFDKVVAQFHHARADFERVKREGEYLRQQRKRLRAIVTVKQEVISLLLPFYPHSISRELQRKIDLAG